MPPREPLFSSHQKFVVAVTMAVVFAASLGLAYAMSSRPPRYAVGGTATQWKPVDLGAATVSIPDDWERVRFDPRGLPMDNVVVWSDPQRTSRLLLTGRLASGQADDPSEILDDVYVALLRHPGFIGQPRSGGMGFRTQTRDTRAASYFLALRDAQGNFRQDLLTLAAPADGSRTAGGEMIVLFFTDSGEEGDRLAMQQNQLYVRAMTQQIDWD